MPLLLRDVEIILIISSINKIQSNSKETRLYKLELYLFIFFVTKKL